MLNTAHSCSHRVAHPVGSVLEQQQHVFLDKKCLFTPLCFIVMQQAHVNYTTIDTLARSPQPQPPPMMFLGAHSRLERLD